jgi:hypothetical protein
LYKDERERERERREKEIFTTFALFHIIIWGELMANSKTICKGDHIVTQKPQEKNRRKKAFLNIKLTLEWLLYS